MKIYFEVPFHSTAWGGGNQFLKYLIKNLRSLNFITTNPEKADIIFFNSHHCIAEIINLKKKYNKKIFIQRIDGPMSYRGIKGNKEDDIIYYLSKNISDGVVFQSIWSQRLNNIKSNYFPNNQIVIHNACDEEIFYKKKYTKFGKKIRLISSSWSSNPDKGLDIIKYLDKTLDKDRFEMTFVGNIKYSPKNISLVEPQKPEKLSNFLRSSDVYILASKTEACSNSLLEAISCGIPVLAQNSSSNPEILNGRGELFKFNDIYNKLDNLIENYDLFLQKINSFSKNHAYQDYLSFFEKCIKSKSKEFNNTNFFYIKKRFGMLRHHSQITFNIKPKNDVLNEENRFLLHLISFLKSYGYKVNFKLNYKTKLIFFLDFKIFNKRKNFFTKIYSNFDFLDVVKFKNNNLDIPVIIRLNRQVDKNRFQEFNNNLKTGHIVYNSQMIKEMNNNQINFPRSIYSVINNQADPKTYNMLNKKKWQIKQELKIVAFHLTKLSKKEIATYIELDELIYQNKNINVSFTYVGELPFDVNFKSTTIVKTSEFGQLSKIFKDSHVLICADHKNFDEMIWPEAIQCGLPIMLSKELEQNLSEEFKKFSFILKKDILSSIEYCKKNYNNYYLKLFDYNYSFTNKMNIEYGYLISKLININKL